MPGVRVYQLAKELKVQSALILELLDRLGKDVHSDLSSIDDPTAHLVRERLTTALANEKKRLLEQQRAQDGGPAAAPSPSEPAVAIAEPVAVSATAEPASTEAPLEPVSADSDIPAAPVPAAPAPAPAETPKAVEPVATTASPTPTPTVPAPSAHPPAAPAAGD